MTTSSDEPVYDKPLPALSNLNRPYWEGLKNRRLALQRCRACEELWYPPSPFCPQCWSRDFEWSEVSGRGTVNSWVVFHQSYFKGFAEDVPYNVAEVNLIEGPRLLTNLVDPDGSVMANEEIELGMEVRIHYADATDEIALAKFERA